MQALGLVWRDVDAAGVQEKRTRILEPVHFGAKLLVDTWRRRRGKDGFVVGRDVPSRPLASILRNLIVYEPMGGARDFRVRLAGSALIRRFDCDITGLKLSELFDPVSYECHRNAMVEIMQEDKAAFLDVKLASKSRTELHFEIVGLPVLSPDRSASWVLGGLFYYDWTK